MNKPHFPFSTPHYFSYIKPLHTSATHIKCYLISSQWNSLHFFLPTSSLTSETMYNTKYFLKTQWSETKDVAQKPILDSASLKPTIYVEKINVPKVKISSIKLASSFTKYLVKAKLKMCSVVKSCESNSYPSILIAFLALIW